MTAVTMTLEQTIEQVKMPEFNGYALFGWVHHALIVPVAYKDLSNKNKTLNNTKLNNGVDDG